MLSTLSTAQHCIADECLIEAQHHLSLSAFIVEQGIVMSMQFGRQSQQGETRCMDVCIISASMSNHCRMHQLLFRQLIHLYPLLEQLTDCINSQLRRARGVQDGDRHRTLTAIKRLNDWLDPNHLS